MKKKIFLAIGSLVVLLGSGCSTIGNMVTSDDSLQKKAAFALGTKPAAVTIKDRTTDGLDAIRFTAVTNNKEYQCYITTVAGAISSDAICKGTDGASKPQCNALLKAAGKC